jgi:hypothetical protein
MPTVEKSRENYIKALQEGICNVVFTKADGTERFMMCTLQADHIPEEQLPKNSSKKKNDDIISVYDLEVKNWRSFRVDSVKWLGWA